MSGSAAPRARAGHRCAAARCGLRLSLLLGLRGVAALDVQLVSYSADGCQTKDLEYELTVASDSCVQFNSRVSTRMECSEDDVLKRTVYRATSAESGFDAYARCNAGAVSYENYDAEPTCDNDNILFGGTSATQVCQNSDSAGKSVEMSYHSQSGDVSGTCTDASTVFRASVAPSSCYNVRGGIARSMKYTCSTDGTMVSVELWESSDRCGGVRSAEYPVESGKCSTSNVVSAQAGFHVKFTCPAAPDAISSKSKANDPLTTTYLIIVIVFAFLLFLAGAALLRMRVLTNRVKRLSTANQHETVTADVFEAEGEVVEGLVLEMIERPAYAAPTRRPPPPQPTATLVPAAQFAASAPPRGKEDIL
ncbi:hypothetical protein M885DRAFT_625368 [Pelagophyceae sp. CCMP2097]|nr:hypothetical protein M885DRAFT_625368 [Pelagophyceae sp. CCMP2097]